MVKLRQFNFYIFPFFLHTAHDHYILSWNIHDISIADGRELKICDNYVPSVLVCEWNINNETASRSGGSVYSKFVTSSSIFCTRWLGTHFLGVDMTECVEIFDVPNCCFVLCVFTHSVYMLFATLAIRRVSLTDLYSCGMWISQPYKGLLSLLQWNLSITTT